MKRLGVKWRPASRTVLLALVQQLNSLFPHQLTCLLWALSYLRIRHLSSILCLQIIVPRFILPSVLSFEQNFEILMCACTQSCLTLCNPMDCSLPGSSVHGISQVSVLEWVAISSSRASSWPRDQTCISCTAGGFFTTCFYQLSSPLEIMELVCVHVQVYSKPK